MKNAIFFLSCVLVFVLIGVMILEASPALTMRSDAQTPTRIAVIVSAPLRPYLEALKGFMGASVGYSFILNDPVILDADIQEGLHAIRSDLLKVPVDAYVSIGPEAFSIAESLSRITEKPWVFSMVLDPRKLLSDSSQSPCGIPLGLPAPEQIQAIAERLPGRSRIGVLYSTSENRSFLEQAEKYAQSLGLVLRAISIENRKTIPLRLMENIKNVDVLWIIPDPAIDSKALVEYIVKSALFNNIPSVGYNRFFLEVGAVMAFVLNYQQIGIETAALLDSYLRSGQCPDSVAAHDVLVNKNVLRRLLDNRSGD